MNKIEQLHRQAIESEVYVDESDYDVLFVANTDKAAIKSAEITEQIAIEFAEWYINVFLDDVIGLNGKEKMDKYKNLKNQGVTKEIIQLWEEQQPKTLYYE